MGSDSTGKFYSFDGLRILLQSNHSELQDALDQRLAQLRLSASSRDQDEPDLTFNFSSVPDAEAHLVSLPTEGVRSVWAHPILRMLYSEERDEMYLDWEGRIRVRVEASSGRMVLSVIEGGKDTLWLASHPLFSIPLMELLKRRGRFALHAASLAVDNRGLLLAGGSGSGKSTLSTALARRGFHLQGDDTVFLCDSPEGIRALGFPDEVNLTRNTAQVLPELDGLLPAAPREGWPKYSLGIVDIAGRAPRCMSRPEVLVFPKVGHTERSTLREFSSQEALTAIIPNLLLTHPKSVQAHLNVFSKLVRQVRCYQLTTGHDFDDLADQLRALLM